MFKNKKNIFLSVLLFLTVAVGTFSYFIWRSGELQKFVVEQVGEKIGMTAGGTEMALVRELLGLSAPRDYLILFLNNTEMRPGGGFIGVYAVATMDSAVPKIIKVEGTEILDNNAPKDFISEPPVPIRDYLKVDRWYFRDSNWSPDFAVSAAKSLSLYRQERGLFADEIKTVIGFTPTVLEEFLALNGPVTVEGMEFTAENFTEKLEYEVEYGYADRGISFDRRKDLVGALTKKILTVAGKKIFSSWGEYKKLFDSMVEQKQIMFYSIDPALQKSFVAHSWSGEMKSGDTDYALWVDANLGALKTDAVLDRDLFYKIYRVDGEYRGQIKMKYAHQGKFDWRTSRYLSYTRLYLPLGTKLLSPSAGVDTGEVNGRTWFGIDVSIEPGRVHEVTFDFILSPRVVEKIMNNEYSLWWQKQLGTNGVGLTVSLDFDKKVGLGEPRENKGRLDDTKYEYAGVLATDKFFQVNLE